MASRAKLTVRLSRENLEFVKRYAVEHGLTVTDVLNRYLTRLRGGVVRVVVLEAGVQNVQTARTNLGVLCCFSLAMQSFLW